MPLRLKIRASTIGSVILDEDGNIDEQCSVTRDQALASGPDAAVGEARTAVRVVTPAR